MDLGASIGPLGQPIRFGIMCTGRTFAAWEAACIRNLSALEGVEPALLLVDDRPPPPKPGLGSRLRSLFNPNTFLWRLYQRAILNGFSHSTRPIDLSKELGEVPVLLCRPDQSGKFVQRFSPEDVAVIREHDLDFIIRFAFNILRGEVLNSARYGIWSFHHGDPERYRGTPPGFWEIYRGDPITGTVLQRLTERLDAGIMLHKGYFKTDASSYARNRDNIFFGAADWPARLCCQMTKGRGAALEAQSSSTSAPIFRAPNSVQMLRFLWTSCRAWIANQYGALFRFQQWSVGIIDAPIEQVAGIVGSDQEKLIKSTRWLPEVAGRFLADPFAVKNEGGVMLLVEDYDWVTELGHIAAIEIDSDGTIGSPRPAIHLPTHLSYPFLLEVDGDLYCVPESSQSDEVSLFRASMDRREWSKVATLVEGVPIIDPTIFRHDEKWWLFGTRADIGDNFNLFAWHSDDMEGPWSPHLANPIKTDVRSSRPAGPPFFFDGQLYRPAQDCSAGYGNAVVVNRVTELTTDSFEEHVVSRVAPDSKGQYPTGLHTLCGAGHMTIIDGSRSALMFGVTGRAFKRKLGRLYARALHHPD